ncbi:Peptidoglycan/LPS O-acetylase OafA/YrhL, contains acyltransferase and SGNH-hydrolase domains [Pseudomonas arsenicoxydans]|uniref:Peptidoglycan/LPS O-acetylase OafA/YrhL, contains acyltransferase and SGNH-hydrolase domains n=1 Tax=Pseudomonas arsenicoxydans TaxID=702115 RepID=A0A1H0RZD4_9PSED|nr:acyltransferase [Pseudomonas arsenicoxydans]SDP34737.1 Peptidoglycan/LPS O-acetylase OafA/YrhL, contains acyltransferase and SGNH-hydrolase domains [Pseudomonas arsenicoxydans]
MMAKSEILPLTGLRFFAALYVFLFHMHIRWPLSDNTYIKNILEQGAIGMSLFFILSGFVLAYRYSNSNTTYRSYLINRFSRIYPIYAFTAIATLPWIGVDFGSGSAIDTTTALTKIALLFIANILVIQAWFPQMFSYWNDGASWSISVEVFCYFLLPFILPKLTNIDNKRLFILSAACVAFSAMIGVSAALFDDPANKVFYSIPIFRLPEFIVGICACIFFLRGNKKFCGPAIQIFIILTVAVYLCVVGSKMPLYVGHNWIIVPSIAFLLISFSVGNSALAKLLSSRIIVWLGKISYCFYSLQFLIIVPLVKHHDSVVQHYSALNNPKILMVCALLILVGASALAHHFIEEPARIWINKRYQTKRVAKPENSQTNTPALLSIPTKN